MCGIHVIIDKTLSVPPQAIEKMVAATSYRGPDDAGVTSIDLPMGRVYLGANRLAITDLSSSASQPMTSGEHSICFNGEIYNHHDLKNTLRTKVQFQSQSDTEVILEHLKAGGTLGELSGMYGIVYTGPEEVVVARDPTGMKKVYYYHDDQLFIASSEIRGIMASGLVEKHLEELAIDDFLTFKYVKPPLTFFQNIYEVLPGEALHISKGGIEHQQTKCDFSSQDELEGLLTTSFLQHIPENQDCSMFFSGGVDSSLMLATLHREGVAPRLYSFIPAEADRKYGTRDHLNARQFARQLGMGLEAVCIDEQTFWSQFGDYVVAADQPVGDSAGFITWMMAKEMSKSFKVALSGAGADELFGGYNRHLALWKYLQHPSLTTFRRMGSLGSYLIPGDRARQMRQFFNQLTPSPGLTYSHFISFIKESNEPAWELSPDIETQMRAALDHDRSNFLVSDVLAINDMAGMQHGLEIRAPYLDPTIVNYTSGLAASELMANGPKWKLKEILTSQGGSAISRRKKEGFGLPLRRWFNSSNRELFAFDTSSILYKFVPQAVVKGMVDEHTHRRKDHGPRLFGLLLLHKWLDRHFG